MLFRFGASLPFDRLADPVLLAVYVAAALAIIALTIAVIVAFVKSGPLPLADKTALVLRIDGTIGEQKTGNLRSTALDQVRGEAVQKVQLRDILNALDAAAEDPKIASLVVVLDDMGLASGTSRSCVDAVYSRMLSSVATRASPEARALSMR